jgi:hypothetical protein
MSRRNDRLPQWHCPSMTISVFLPHRRYVPNAHCEARAQERRTPLSAARVSWQPLEHKRRTRRTQGRKLLRLPDRPRRGLPGYTRVAQSLKKSICGCRKQVNFFYALRLGEELTPRHKRSTTASTAALGTDRQRAKQCNRSIHFESDHSVRALTEPQPKKCSKWAAVRSDAGNCASARRRLMDDSGGFGNTFIRAS